MKIEQHSVVEFTQPDNTLNGIYKQIERCGRVCYQSDDKITEDSYKSFFERMKTSKHMSVLEHGTVYLQLTDDVAGYVWTCNRYAANHYSRVVYESGQNWRERAYITTNMRVIVENGWEDDLQYLCEPTDKHIKRICFKVRTSIGVSREFNRHRVLSVSEQSTRYCNYSKEKFGGKIAFIKPTWLNGLSESEPEFEEWLGCMSCASHTYAYLTFHGYHAQDARSVLPLDTATTVVYTAFDDDWDGVLKLRSSKAGAQSMHPDANVIGNMIYDLMHK